MIWPEKLLIASSLMLAGAMASCYSLNVNSSSVPLNGSVDTAVKADIEVGEKISGKSSATKIIFFTLSDDNAYCQWQRRFRSRRT